VVTPLKLIETYSADALRYWTARARAGVDTIYDENVFKLGKRLETKLYNASKFVFGRLADVDESLLVLSAITFELDRGFVARLGEVVETLQLLD
jgi:valyl-tRNA synthetase